MPARHTRTMLAGGGNGNAGPGFRPGHWRADKPGEVAIPEGPNPRRLLNRIEAARVALNADLRALALRGFVVDLILEWDEHPDHWIPVITFDIKES